MGDLHLSLAVNKPMDLFGGVWNGYVEKIRTAWLELISPDDTVLLAGDTSWGMSLDEALLDFQFIEALPGKKLLLKGNHDYFWTTVTGMRRFLTEHGLTTIDFLHNAAVELNGIAYCGTRGWFLENEGTGVSEGGKVYRRELIRLQASLEEGKKTGAEELVAVCAMRRLHLHSGAVSWPNLCLQRHGAANSAVPADGVHQKMRRV